MQHPILLVNINRIWIYLFLTLILAKSNENEGTSIKVSRVAVTYATKTSFIIEAHVKGTEFCEAYRISWRYTKDVGSLDSTNTTYMDSNESWPSANGVHSGKISELEPETTYRIHAIIRGCQNIQWQEEATAIATTCPNEPHKTPHVVIENVETYSFMAMWQIPEKSCVSTFYYINVFEYLHTGQEKIQSDSCPKQGIPIKSTPSLLCKERRNYLCYYIPVSPVESTQYGIEVWTSDNSGNCSKGANIAYVKINIGETNWSVFLEALRLSGLYCSILWALVVISWVSAIFIKYRFFFSL